MIAAALRRIGPKHASALLMRYHLRLTAEEAATALDINANTANVRLVCACNAIIDAYAALNNDNDNDRTSTSPAREARS